eukprot:883592-Amphidinium_carterae.1
MAQWQNVVAIKSITRLEQHQARKSKKRCAKMSHHCAWEHCFCCQLRNLGAMGGALHVIEKQDT